VDISSFACTQLSRLNPLARLAWAGRKRRTPDELNPGAYCLVQLYPMRIVASLEEPQINNELWYVTTRADRHKNPIRVRIDRGPIFNKTGGLVPDWDPLTWVPVFVARFSDYGLPDSSIPHGGFRDMVESWQTDAKERYMKSVRERGAELKDKVDNIAGDAADRLWSEANRGTQFSTSTTTREERVAAQAELENQKADFEGYYDGTKVWRG
jgi:hypothetical protein